MSGDPIADALRSAIAAATADARPAGDAARPRLIAIGWATVEFDRALAQLGTALGTTAAAFRPGAGSEALGASCRVGAGLLDGGVDLAVVEPSREGRLAAHLARHGEGPTIAWLAGPREPRVSAAAGSAGPFGPEEIIPARGDGLLRLLVGPSAGTIPP